MTAFGQITNDKYRRGNQKDWTGDSSKKRITPRSTPTLPASLYVQLSNYRWCLAHDGVTATLSYKWLEEMWTVEFDTPGIRYLQFDRDVSAMDMRRIIINEIDRTRPDWISF